MTIILVNCKQKLLAKGIDITANTWHESLTTQLQSYVSFEGWDYDFENDTLKLTIPGTVTVPANIVDFGEGSEVTLG